MTYVECVQEQMRSLLVTWEVPRKLLCLVEEFYKFSLIIRTHKEPILSPNAEKDDRESTYILSIEH